MTATRREAMALLGAASLIPPVSAQTGGSVTGSKPPLTLVSRHVQWTGFERAIEVAAEAGFDGIAWTVRPGAHVEPANVERDLPRIVEMTRRAGLSTPMIITSIGSVEAPHAEAILATMKTLGISKYRAGSGRYDFTSDLAPQHEAMRRRVAELAALNQRYGTQAMFHTHSSGSIGGAGWDLWMLMRDLDPAYVSLNFDIGHVVVKGGTGWRETLMSAHRHVGALSLKDFQWGLIEEPQPDQWPWRVNWVRPGQGMVNFPELFAYLRSIQFSGPFEQYFEYNVPKPDGGEINMLGTNYGEWNLEIPEAEFIRYLREDVAFYNELMAPHWG
jgi:L-ribulose-5-phosphate 3-epimerase